MIHGKVTSIPFFSVRFMCPKWWSDPFAPLGNKLFLTLLVIGSLFSILEADAADRQTNYPPYGEVWDWKAPKSYLGSLKVRRADNGDVRILFRVGLPKEVGKVVTTTFFFQGEITTPTDDELTGIWGQLKPRREVRLNDGSTVRVFSRRGTRSHGCYDNLDGSIVKTDGEGKQDSQWRVIYVLPTPSLYQTKPQCLDGPKFLERVGVLSGDLIRLDDDTFLLADSQFGLVIRFNGMLQSKSKLLGSRIFTVPEEKYMALASKFDDNELQLLHDELYRSVTSSKKGDKE